MSAVTDSKRRRGAYTSFYTDREQVEALNEIARERGVSRSTLIREAIESTYGLDGSVRKTAHTAPKTTARA